MALPTSAPKVTCTLSKPLLADGTEGAIKSATLRMDRDLVWVPTGETLYKEAVPIPVADGVITFEVIPVNAPSVRDSAGQAVINWVYTLRVVVTLPSSQERTIDYNFQPMTGQTVDLDLIPHLGAVILPPVVSPGIIDGGSL